MISLIIPKEGIESCVICSESDASLMQRKNAESWARLYRTAAIKQYHHILDLSTAEQNFSQSPVKDQAS